MAEPKDGAFLGDAKIREFGEPGEERVAGNVIPDAGGDGEFDAAVASKVNEALDQMSPIL